MRQPKIELVPDTLDRYLLALTIIGLLFLVGIPIWFYDSLPEKIPVHFGLDGKADRFGNKTEIWLFSIIGVLLVIFLWGISRFPHTFNYATKITEENAKEQYANGVKMIRVLAAIISIGFACIIYEMIQSAVNQQGDLNPFFLPIFLLGIFGSIGYFIGKSLKG